jgi:hypothetical protein
MQNYLLKGASSEDFREKLNEAAKKTLTAHEQLEQKVSFIYGSIKSDTNGVTKDRIREVLNG